MYQLMMGRAGAFRRGFLWVIIGLIRQVLFSRFWRYAFCVRTRPSFALRKLGTFALFELPTLLWELIYVTDKSQKWILDFVEDFL